MQISRPSEPSEGLLFSALCGANAADGLRTAFANAVRNPLTNAVGYQMMEVPQGNSIFTVTFEDVGGNGYKFTDIAVVNENGQEFDDKTSGGVGRLRDKLTCQKMDFTSGGLISKSYKYTTQIPTGLTEMNGWKYDGSPIKDMTPEEQATHVFSNGEAIYIKNSEKTAKVFLRFNGQVSLKPMSFELTKGNVLIGNMTPVPVAIKDIKVGKFIEDAFVEYDDKTSGGIGRLRDKITCQKMDLETGGLISTSYKYTTQIPTGKSEMNGWKYDGTPIKDMTEEEQAKHVLNPGEGFYLKYSDASLSAWLKFPEPVSK